MKDRKTNPDVHIICGKCGCATMMKYKVSNQVYIATNETEINVFLICENCSTLTGLDDLLEKDNN